MIGRFKVSAKVSMRVENQPRRPTLSLIMKTLLACLALTFAWTVTSHAAPLGFPEVSLLVRMGEAEGYITGQLAERRLLRALTPEQETRLKTEGASEGLLRALRQPANVLPTAEAVAFETWSAEQKKGLEKKLARLEAEQNEREAARVAVAAAWQKQQDENAAMGRAAALADIQYTALSTPDYYGSYGYPYAPYAPCATRSRGPSSFSLQWQNGSATTYQGPGLFYQPLGSNGANTQARNFRPAQRAHGQGGGVDRRFGR
jgi:hypothetical protein